MNTWGKIYESTWWGNPQQTGWGSSYYSIANPVTPSTAWSLITSLWQNETRTYSEI